jgi:toxin FitB
MLILDTNVVSDQMSKRPSALVANWMDSFDSEEVFMTTVVLSELYFGAWLVKEHSRRDGLFQSINRIRAGYGARMLDFDEAAAELFGRICSERQHRGHVIETKDAQIAAICLVHGATLATRNVRDFEGLGLKLINPFEG